MPPGPQKALTHWLSARLGQVLGGSESPQARPLPHPFLLLEPLGKMTGTL